MTRNEYSQLKQQLLICFESSDNHTYLTNLLKEFYKNDVDSIRRFEQINTLGQLLTILEIRDILSEINVAPLKEISRILCNSVIMDQIISYENAHKAEEEIKTNLYDIQKPLVTKASTPSFINNCYQNLSPLKFKRINDTIIEEIGTFWRDFARNLKIREGIIDDIDNNNKTLSDKASHLLSIYNDKCDPQKWFFVLCDALEKTRRKDLCRSLQEIMAMNI